MPHGPVPHGPPFLWSPSTGRPSTCTPRVRMEGHGKDHSLLTSHTTAQSGLPFLLTSPDEALLGLWGSQALSSAFS